jgi:hypothetical protein
MWIALWVVLALFLLLIGLILFDPFELCIDTVRNDYHLRWRALGSARLKGPVDDPVLRVWVLGWRREFRMLDWAAGEKKPQAEKPRRKKTKAGSGRPRWLTWRFALRMLRTFRVRRLRVQLDTGDYALNGLLYPVFVQLSRWAGHWRIAFGGPSELDLLVTNRGWDVLVAFLTGILSSKKRES